MLRIGTLLFAALIAGHASANAGRSHFENGDYAAAASVWAPLAARGDRWAMVGLGHVAAMRGADAEAARWYHAAAVRGHVEAQVLLASAYLEGRGVAWNPALAYAWYHLAAQNGHAKAEAARDMAGGWLSDERRAEARATVRRWLIDGMPETP